MKNLLLHGVSAVAAPKAFRFILLAILLTSGVAEAKRGPTPPQFVVVRKLPPAAVMSRMQATCLQRGQSVVQATDTQVICSKPMDDSMRSIFIRALATPTYSTNPVYYFRVSAVRVGDSTTVAAEEYVQYQNAYGQQTNIPITNRKELESISAGLANMKATWEARLDAAGDDEGAALAASDAALASAGGKVANVAPLSPASTTTPKPEDMSGPSAGAAKQALAKFQCFDDFRIVGESSGKTLFEAKCSAGGTQLVECRGTSCKPLH